MPIPEAIEMLRRENDVHFSREIVEAFINFIRRNIVWPYDGKRLLKIFGKEITK